MHCERYAPRVRRPPNSADMRFLSAHMAEDTSDFLYLDDVRQAPRDLTAVAQQYWSVGSGLTPRTRLAMALTLSLRRWI